MGEGYLCIISGAKDLWPFITEGVRSREDLRPEGRMYHLRARAKGRRVRGEASGLSGVGGRNANGTERNR